MTRILPVQPNNTPPMSAPLLDVVKTKIGRVPNLIQTLAHSPAALRFYLSQTEALETGTLDTKLREQIALTTAGINACDYCASVHTLIGKSRGIASDELSNNLVGKSNEPKIQVALNFVRQILDTRGLVDDAALESLKSAGFIDSEIIEIVAHVGMNIFTNYFNHVAKVTIDFPFVSSKLSK